MYAYQSSIYTYVHMNTFVIYLSQTLFHMDAPFGRVHTINLCFLIMTAFVQQDSFLPIAKHKVGTKERVSTNKYLPSISTYLYAPHNPSLLARRNARNVRRRQISCSSFSLFSAPRENFCRPETTHHRPYLFAFFYEI